MSRKDRTPLGIDRPDVGRSEQGLGVPADCVASGEAAATCAVEGYLHPAYAASLAEFGRPLELPGSRGWLLRRAIPGTDLFDAMGCYPLFCCQDWGELARDLSAVRQGLVSVCFVADPFCDCDAARMKEWLDVALCFKEHFVCDLAQDPGSFVTKHHRYCARDALRHATVEVADHPVDHLDEWTDLYANLVRRHGLRGIKAFSRDSFRRQLGVPGLVMLRITDGGVCLGAHLWYIQRGVAYSHLMAVSEAGYAANSSYGLYWRAIEMFRKSFSASVRILDLGAGAGLAGDKTDGLAWFKKGWSTGIRPAWFCGKIMDRSAYDLLATSTSSGDTSYFPAYRRGEFG